MPRTRSTGDRRKELAAGRAAAPLIKVEDVAYVMFEKPHLERCEAFFDDFGLRRARRTRTHLFLRGYGSAPFCVSVRQGTPARFVGFGLRAHSAADLKRVAALPGASAVEHSKDPGGGERVRLTAPTGVEVHVVHGQDPAAPLPMRAPLPTNHALEKARLNATQRPALAPAEILRLGHVVMQTRHFSTMLHWLMTTFGVIVSDYQVLERYPEGGPVLAFIRCDRGDTPADHHTIALAAGFSEQFEHAAFEVQDLDAVAMGGEYLRSRNWTRAWGVGRHILGSQIFDYWRDGDGMTFEHFADGDLFDAGVPTGRSPFGRSRLAQWGPPVPNDFFGSLGPGAIIDVVRALRESEDISVRKLYEMARALSAR